jgi:hypothetical protein
MSLLFDLNDEMLEGMDRIRYALGFSFWAGGLIALGSIFYALWLVFVEPSHDSGWYALLLAVIAWVSAYACYSAHAERSFLEDYSILGWGVQRANEWKPNPKIPEGPDAVSRLVAYLKETDDRIGYILEKNPQKLQRNASVKGKSKEMHSYDLFMNASKPIGILSDPVPEGMILMVRKVEKATVDDVKGLKKASEDVLKRLYPCDQSARVVLLQTVVGKFPEEVAEFANKNWMKYDRSIDDGIWDWSSPIELVGEAPDRTYNLENMYFG